MNNLIGKLNFFNLLKVPSFELNFNPWYHFFSPRVELSIETKKYTLQSAKKEDLVELFKLRSEIFRQETKSENISELDFDHLDFKCDHLVIRHKESGEICGTYRILVDMGQNFYSCSEFNIDSFLTLPGTKMEIGRACIALDHRNGHVIDLLWRGLGEYAMQINARYLFGCSSVFSTSTLFAQQVVSYLKAKEKFRSDKSIHPVQSCLPQHYEILEQATASDANGQLSVPPLLMSYLSAGAEVWGIPAYDYAWECFDLFTVLDLEKINPSYQRRYFSKSDETQELKDAV